MTLRIMVFKPLILVHVTMFAFRILLPSLAREDSQRPLESFHRSSWTGFHVWYVFRYIRSNLQSISRLPDDYSSLILVNDLAVDLFFGHTNSRLSSPSLSGNPQQEHNHSLARLRVTSSWSLGQTYKHVPCFRTKSEELAVASVCLASRRLGGKIDGREIAT